MTVTELTKTRAMSITTLIITMTLCMLLLIYAGFSMYHQKTMTESEFKVFTGIAYGLNNIVVMWFTAEITQRKAG